MCNQVKAKKLEDAKRIVHLIDRIYKDTCMNPHTLLSCIRVPMPDMYHAKIVIGRFLSGCDLYVQDLNVRVADTTGKYDDWLIREFSDYSNLLIPTLKGEYSITYADPASDGLVTLTLQLDSYSKIVDLHISGLSVFTLFLQQLFEEISWTSAKEVQNDILKFYHPDTRETYKAAIAEIYEDERKGVWSNA